MTEPKSSIDDFAEINRRMKELKGEPSGKKLIAKPAANQVSGFGGEDCLCRGMGWIAVRSRKTSWSGLVCPQCGNPNGIACPL